MLTLITLGLDTMKRFDTPLSNDTFERCVVTGDNPMICDHSRSTSQLVCSARRLIFSCVLSKSNFSSFSSSLTRLRTRSNQQHHSYFVPTLITSLSETLFRHRHDVRSVRYDFLRSAIKGKSTLGLAEATPHHLQAYEILVRISPRKVSSSLIILFVSSSPFCFCNVKEDTYSKVCQPPCWKESRQIEDYQMLCSSDSQCYQKSLRKILDVLGNKRTRRTPVK